LTHTKIQKCASGSLIILLIQKCASGSLIILLLTNIISLS